MTAPALDKDKLQTVQQILADLQDNGIDEYVIFNNEGIPMRYNQKKWTHQRAVHYAGLISDFLQVTRKQVSKDLNTILHPEGDIDYIRLRTRKGTEFIITSDKVFTICVIQKCYGDIVDEDFGEEKDGEDKKEKKE